MEPIRRRMWVCFGRICAAHVSMLEHSGLIDEDARLALTGAIDNVARGEAPDAGSLVRLLNNFAERVGSVGSAGYAGAARIGRGTLDVLHTAARLIMREELREIVTAPQHLREVLIDSASRHTVSL